MKKLFSLLLALALLGCLGASAEEAEGVYVLMTIPYDMFYEAEGAAGQYDSVSSATRVKPLMMEYAGGSFHFMPDGREITGVIYPVFAESEALLAMYGGEEVTDATAVTVTVRDGGETFTRTYTGKDALFESFPFSYYRLSEVPAVFLTLRGDSSFGPFQGPVIELEGTISVVPSAYADVCLRVEGADEALTGLNVNAAVIVAEDGTKVGMKHVENIWEKTLFGFTLDSQAYALLRGKKIGSVELYTFDAKFVVTSGGEVAVD